MYNTFKCSSSDCCSTEALTRSLQGFISSSCARSYTNWRTDLSCLLFLDLIDIPGDFSNCQDLICTVLPFLPAQILVGDLEVLRHFKGVGGWGRHYATLYPDLIEQLLLSVIFSSYHLPFLHV